MGQRKLFPAYTSNIYERFDDFQLQEIPFSKATKDISCGWMLTMFASKDIIKTKELKILFRCGYMKYNHVKIDGSPCCTYYRETSKKVKKVLNGWEMYMNHIVM